MVIGDTCPWVAQSAEAFLSKIFACSYSIAGLNVLSGNPADHLVHRHTHRVVRGSLFVCGRPDGRLTALTTLEASTCLAVNQASSIQSLGGTCETITIGHNAANLPLSFKGICLEDYRPKFLCEKMLEDQERKDNAIKARISACDDETETNHSNCLIELQNDDEYKPALPVLRSMTQKVLRRQSTDGSGGGLTPVFRRRTTVQSTGGDDSELRSNTGRRQSNGRTTGTLLGESLFSHAMILFTVA